MLQSSVASKISLHSHSHHHSHSQFAAAASSSPFGRRDSLAGRYSSASPEPAGSQSPGGRSSSSPGRSACICDVCGKRYKHRSCLHKHLWEHHDAWEACLKYNLTKHQQVQMMEAAQVLVEMMGPRAA